MHASSVSCQSHFHTTGRCNHYFSPFGGSSRVSDSGCSRHSRRSPSYVSRLTRYRVLLANIASVLAAGIPPPSISSTSCSPLYAPRFTSLSSSTPSYPHQGQHMRAVVGRIMLSMYVAMVGALGPLICLTLGARGEVECTPDLMNTTRLSHYVWNRHPPALPLQNAFGCSCQGTTHVDELSMVSRRSY